MAFSITFIALIFYRISRTFSKTNRTDSSLHFNFFAIQKCYRMPIIAGIFRPIYFNFKIILTSGNVICLYFCIIRSQISPCFGTIYFPTAPSALLYSISFCNPFIRQPLSGTLSWPSVQSHDFPVLPLHNIQHLLWLELPEASFPPAYPDTMFHAYVV